VGTELHPLLQAEVRRWLGSEALSGPVRSLLEALSVRLVVIDDVRAADSAGELEAFFRLSGDYLLVLDAELKVRHLNTAFESWGYGISDFRGRSFLELVVETERESAAATLSSMLRTHEQVPLATRVLTAKGAKHLVHWQMSTDTRGERIFAVGRDVTEQERLKETLTQTQRMEAMGRLAASVAHEVNTPLQFLNDNVGFVEDALKDLAPVFDAATSATLDAAELSSACETADLEYLRSELPRALDGMRDGLRRVAHLVTALKELAPDTGEAHLEPLDLLPVLRAAIASQCALRPGLEVCLELETLPLINLHVATVVRAVTAVLDNALKAIAERHGPTGGRLEVRARIEGGLALISIQDDGVGISDEVRSHLFEPFFTTRDVGAGSGQGLALARSIMERHHGAIELTSAPGMGATFTLQFPLPIDESLWD